MTDTNTKVRSLILTALMVVSVFGGSIAFAGSAAAATNQASFSASPSDAGETATLTASAVEDSSYTFQNIQVSFNGANNFDGSFSGVADADVTVTVYSNPGDTSSEAEFTDATIAQTSNGGATATVSLSSSYSLDGGEEVEVTMDNFQNPTTTGDYTGTFDLDPQSSGNSASSTSSADDLTIASSSTSSGLDAEIASATEFTKPSDSPEHSYVQVVFDRSVDDVTNLNYRVTGSSGTEYTTGAELTQVTSYTTTDAKVAVVEFGSGVNLNGGSATVAVSADTDFTDDDQVTADVTTTSASIDATDAGTGSATATIDDVAYEGANIAVVSDGFDNGDMDTSYELFTTTEVSSGADAGNYNNDEFLFSGSTGMNSFVAVEDSGDNDQISAGNVYNGDFSGPTSQISVRSLGLTAEAVDTAVNYNEGGSATIEADITSNVGGRTVEATLLDSSGDAVTGQTQTLTIGSNREATVSFTGITTEGSYTVEVVDASTGITAETDSVSVSEVSGAASFENSVVTQDRGDIAEFTVNLDNTDEAVVYLGSEQVSYHLKLELTDGNDDGEVTVLLNSYTAGTSADGITVADTPDGDDPDMINVVSSFQRDTTDNDMEGAFAGSALLDASEYDLTVEVGGTEQGLATLVLQERATNGMTIGTMSGTQFGEADSAMDVSYTEDSTIAAGDVLVHEVDISGIYGAVNDKVADDTNNIDDAEAALLDLVASNDEIDLVALQTRDSTQANQNPKILDFAATNNNGGLNVYADDQNNTLFVNVDTSEAVFDRVDRSAFVDSAAAGGFDDSVTPTNVNVPAAADDEFEVTLSIDEASALADSDEMVSQTFEVVGRTAEFDVNEDDEITVQPASGQELTGETSVAPGTELTVQARATGDNPFLKTASTTVQDDGTFAVSLNFADTSVNTTFTASVRGFSESAVDGTVGAAAATPTPTPEPTATPTPTPEPATDTPTPEPATDTPTPEPATDTPTEGGDGATETDSTSGSQPGFGGAVAIVALAGAALIALRRNN